jgi:hypothetical protein
MSGKIKSNSNVAMDASVFLTVTFIYRVVLISRLPCQAFDFDHRYALHMRPPLSISFALLGSFCANGWHTQIGSNHR